MKKIILDRVHPSLDVEPFIPYYESVGYKVETEVLPNGWTVIYGSKDEIDNTAIKTTSLKHYKELLAKGKRAQLVSKEDLNKKSFADGGMIDLFEDYDNIPANVQEILDKYELEDADYETIEQAKNEIELQGYTFEYGLDGTLYGLRPIGVELSDLDGYEDEEFAKGGNTKNKSYIAKIIDSSGKGIYEEQIKSLLDEHFIDYYIDRNNTEGVVYEIGEPRDGQFERDVKALIKKINKGKPSMDIYSVYVDIDKWDYFDYNEEDDSFEIDEDLFEIDPKEIDKELEEDGERFFDNLVKVAENNLIEFYIDTDGYDKEDISLFVLYKPTKKGTWFYNTDLFHNEYDRGNLTILHNFGKDILNEYNYAKGGQTRSKRSRTTDRNRLSNEPWEQAYLPNRKGSYYAHGGDVKGYLDNKKEFLKGKNQQERIDILISDVSKHKWSSIPLTENSGIVKNYAKTYELEPIRVASIFNKYQKKTYADGGNVGLGVVKVIFGNPEYNYTTNVSPDTTEEEARKYFIGKTFDVGVFPKENMQEVVDIEFYKQYSDGGGVEIPKPTKSIFDFFKNHTKRETYLYNNRLGWNKGLQTEAEYDSNHKWIGLQDDSFGNGSEVYSDVSFSVILDLNENNPDSHKKTFDNLSEREAEILAEKLYNQYKDNKNVSIRIFENMEFAKGGNTDNKLIVGKEDFSFLLNMSDKELSKRLDLVHKQQKINSNQYFSAFKSKASTSEIEEAGKRLSNQEKAIIEARIRVDKFANGGRVKIVNKGIKYTPDMYSGIMGDRDNDGVENADDLDPNNPKVTAQIEQVKFTDTFQDLLTEKENYDEVMYDLVGKMESILPEKYNIYARTKTPFSIIKKLVEKRIKGSKGLTDMIGTTIVVNNNNELKEVSKMIGGSKGAKGIFGEVLDYDDFVTNPNCGYRAYHFIVNYNGTPAEIQLKTKLMKQLNEFSHEFYKDGSLDCVGMGEVAGMITEADNGNKEIQKEVVELLANKEELKKMISNKFAEGGEVEWFDYSEANLRKLPYDLDRYFVKNENTIDIPISQINPTRARKKGVLNANKFMLMAYNGEMNRRNPISIYKRNSKWFVLEGNSTLANAIASEWETIYADVVADPEKQIKDAEENVKIVRFS